MNYTFKITDTKNKDFFSRLKDTRPLMRKISLAALSEIQKNIERGTKPENAPVTKAVKQGDKTLRDTGSLLASLNARNSASEASVRSNHIAAAMNNPEDNRTHIIIKPKRAKYLTFPASAQTRTFQRRYGFTPREVISGLEKDGWNVYRPMVASGSRPANIILARKPAGKNGKQKRQYCFLFYANRSNSPYGGLCILMRQHLIE